MPTRLLDWSTNPLVALYFAVEKGDEIDGVVYALCHGISDQYGLFDFKTADVTKEHRNTPAGFIQLQPNQGKVIFIRPKYSDQRYLNQKSVFSCTKDVFKPLVLEGIEKIIVRSSLKPELRLCLRTIGISTFYV